jgi:nucleoside-diphosphate kinase
MVSFDEPMVFNVSWFDEMGAVDRPYRLLFYPMDNSVEIIDIKSGKVHLRRIRNFDVQKSALFVGNQIQIYGRTYKIAEFGDQITKQQNVNMKEKTFVLIKPDAYIHMGKIISDITSLGFQISRMSMLRFNEQDIAYFYSDHVGKPYFQ